MTTVLGRIPVFVGGLALAVAAVIFTPDAAQARDECGALSSGAATCNAQTYASGIRYDVAPGGWVNGVAGPVTITVTGTTSAPTTITLPTSTPWGSGIVVRTAQQTDTTSRTIALTVGAGDNAGNRVAIVQSTNTNTDGFDNTGVVIHQRGNAADATTVTLGSGVTIGSGMTSVTRSGVHVLVENGNNTATHEIDSAATIHSAEFGLIMDNRGAGNTVITNSGSITTTATGSSANNKSGIRILDWSHNPSGNSFGGDDRTAATTTTVTNSGSVTVSGQRAHGVHVAAEGLGLYKTVNSGTVSASGAGGHGILVEARYHTGAAGSKAIEIENSGLIMATGADGGGGIYVETVDNAAPAGRSIGNVEIENSGSITARNNAILVNANMGAVSVDHSGAGTVSSSHADGIHIRQGGTGGVTVTSSADVTAENHGIIVSSIPTPAAMLTEAAGLTTKSVDVTVSSGMTATTWPSAVTVSAGTSAATYVTPGDVSVTHSGGKITARTGNGIYVAQRGGADATVLSSADITARGYGIYVTNRWAVDQVAIAAGTTTWSSGGAISVTHSAGAIEAETRQGIAVSNAYSNPDAVTVKVTGGSVSTEGQSRPAVSVRQNGTGDAVASVSSGATLTSKHNAGIYARLRLLNAPLFPNADAVAGQVKVTQAGTIAGRKGVYAHVSHESAMGETRAAANQPLIDVTWTGSFSHGTTATVAGNDNDRFLAATATAAVAVTREVETEKATRYGQAAGIEAQVLTWRSVATRVAEGDDPGPIADNAAQMALLAATGTGSRRAAILKAFKAALGNGDIDVADEVFDAIKSGATSLTGVTDAEIVTYLSTDDDDTRTLLRNVLAQSLSDKEKAVLQAVVTNTGLDAALDDADADFSDAYKTAVKAFLNRFNVGNIRIAVGNTSVASSIVASRGDDSGDGIRAYYATPNDKNGRIDVTIAAGSTVTGANAGVYVANAGMGTVTASSEWGRSLELEKREIRSVPLRQQFVTVHGTVTGGMDAAVHLAGGGVLLVGERGRLVAGDSGRAILVNDPGRSEIVIDGEVRGGLADGTPAVETTGGGGIILGQTGRVVTPDDAPNAIRRTSGGDEIAPVILVVDGAVNQDSAKKARERLGGKIVGDAAGNSVGFLATDDEDNTTGRVTSAPLANGEIDTSGLPESTKSMDPPPGTMVCGMDDHHRCRLYEALPSVLLAMNGLPSRGERMSAPRDAHGAWARVETASGQWQAADSTETDLAYDHGRYGARAGVDVAVGEGSRLGLSVHSLRGEAEMTRRGGKVELSAVGLGVSATSLFGGGFHVDASAQATRFDVDMTSGLGRRLKEGDGSGWALGLEAGRSMTLNSGLSVMPNLGLVWSQASLDTFTDAYGGHRVSMDDAESLTGRAGLSVESEASAGVRLFGSLDVTHEFSEETEVMVSGTRLAASAETTGVRVGVGGLFDLGNGASLRGSADYTSAGGGNSAYGAGLGVTMSF